MIDAYACRIATENFSAIASEKPGFDLEATIRWLYEHGSGYFVRDEGSSFDCEFFDDIVFHEIYKFKYSDIGTLFRVIVRV